MLRSATASAAYCQGSGSTLPARASWLRKLSAKSGPGFPTNPGYAVTVQKTLVILVTPYTLS
jgi:hypothetical protein